MGEYTLDNTWYQARRLALLEAWLDPGTIRHLEVLGVGEGWHCLEVGGGGGSVVEWLSRCIGPSGHVFATDISTRFLDALDLPNLEVHRHDIVHDDLPEGAFDLVHARLVLTHLAERDTALRRMVKALKPGGWLLVEEMDCLTWIPDPASDATAVALFRKGVRAIEQNMSAAGVDLYYGRRLFGEVRTHKLIDLAAEGRALMGHGGTPNAHELRLTAEQLLNRDSMSVGLLSEQERRDYLALLEHPDFVWMGQMVMAVWGRR